MARGRKRKKHITPRAQIVESKRDISREKEFLSQKVRLDGKGEDPWFQALVYDLPDASEVESRQIALAVQKNLRGDASIDANAELSQIRSEILEEAAEYEKDARRFEESNIRFVDEVLRDAPKLTKAQAERERQKGMTMFKNAVKAVKAGRATNQLQFKEMLKRAPLVEINVAPIVYDTPNGPVMRPVTLGILGLRFTLEPGIQKVPKPLADLYTKFQHEQTYVRMKKAMWSGQTGKGIMHVDELAQATRELDKQYGTK